MIKVNLCLQIVLSCFKPSKNFGIRIISESMQGVYSHF